MNICGHSTRTLCAVCVLMLRLRLVLQMVLKCADIGHLAADLRTHKRWAYLLEEEFFRQVRPPSCVTSHLMASLGFDVLPMTSSSAITMLLCRFNNKANRTNRVLLALQSRQSAQVILACHEHSTAAFSRQLFTNTVSSTANNVGKPWCQAAINAIWRCYILCLVVQPWLWQ